MMGESLGRLAELRISEPKKKDCALLWWEITLQELCSFGSPSCNPTIQVRRSTAALIRVQPEGRLP
jgi:hypothetical protein